MARWGGGAVLLYALGRTARLFPGCNALSIGWRAAGVENTQARVPAGERQARPLASRRGTRERVPVACRVAARPAARVRAARVIRKVGRLCVFLAELSFFDFSFAPGPGLKRYFFKLRRTFGELPSRPRPDASSASGIKTKCFDFAHRCDHRFTKIASRHSLVATAVKP